VFVYGWHSKSEEIMPCRFRAGQRGNGKPEPNPALLTVRERERDRIDAQRQRHRTRCTDHVSIRRTEDRLINVRTVRSLQNPGV